ncbi:MAG: TrmH family RNA methyltransferase, partial [Candidatus Rokuibacteriota bacterium]
AEGRLVVRRLLEASRFRARSLLLTPRALDDLRDLLAGDDAPPAYLASAETIRAVVGFKFHRGCLAAAARGAPLRPEALIEPPGARTLLALEELADPDNVGAVFRNAAAFQAAGVLLSPGCADPLYRKAIRVGMGATLSIPFARTDWRGGLERLRAAGYTLVALTPDRDAEDISAVEGRGPLPRRLALLVGAEGPGLGASTRAAADRRVRIPMAAGADSLNVATACGIALHRLA